MRLRFEDNLYFAGPGQGWFRWGTTWARHESYAGLSEFQSNLRIDQGGRVVEPGFANPTQFDLRLSPDTLAKIRGCYPLGPIPGVVLGPLDR